MATRRLAVDSSMLSHLWLKMRRRDVAEDAGNEVCSESVEIPFSFPFFNEFKKQGHQLSGDEGEMLGI